MSIGLIYVFADSTNIFRFVPLILLFVILSQLVVLLSMLDNMVCTKSQIYSVDELAKQASLEICNDISKLEIKQIFRIGDKSMIGTVIILLASTVFISLLSKTDDLSSQLVIIVIGVILIIISTLTIIRQFVDGVKIIGNKIIVSYNLRRKSMVIDKSVKVKVEIERKYIRRSNFIVITHHLQSEAKWIPILTFQMDLSNSKNALRLGKEIENLIKDRLG